MNGEIKVKIESLKNGEIPKGYTVNGNRIMPVDWNVVPISKLVEKVTNPVVVENERNYKQIGIRSHGKGLFYKDEVNGVELGNKAVFWIEADCFIVNIVFAWELAVGRTTKNEVGMIASHRFPMYRPINNKMDLDFLTYFFKSPFGKKLLELASPGGAGRNKTLGQKEFMSLNIPVPHVKEQQKISEIISIWDKAIDLKEKLVLQKKMQKKYLMKKILTAKVRLPGYEDDWNETPFIQCFKTISVKKYQIKSDEYLNSGKFPVVDQGKNKIAAYYDNAEKVYKCPKSGVVVFGDHTRVLKYIDFDFVIGADGTQILVGKDDYETNFLFHLLEDRDVPNTGYNRHFKYLKEMVFLIPCLDEQKAISVVLNTANEELLLLEHELSALRVQKKGLMQLLLTGIVRV